MSERASRPWVVLALGLLVALAAWVAACDTEGVTPNCPADGGDCITLPGDANPSPTSDGGPS